MKHDKSVYQDTGGYAGSARVAVPPCWTGESRHSNKRARVEEHSLERATKTAKMSGEEAQKYIDELGFWVQEA